MEKLKNTPRKEWRSDESKSWMTSERDVRNDLATVHRLAAFYGMDQLLWKNISAGILTYEQINRDK